MLRQMKTKQLGLIRYLKATYIDNCRKFQRITCWKN